MASSQRAQIPAQLPGQLPGQIPGQIIDLRIGRSVITWALELAMPYRVMLVCLAAYCMIGAAFVAVTGSRLIDNGWENTHPEGPHVYVAIQAARTGRLYFPFTQSPYVIQSYGPLYYAINAGIAWASHLDVTGTVLRARLLSYACYLLSGFLVFAISRRAGSSLLLSSLAALMMLGHPDFVSWNATVRPDMLFIFAMLLSLYFAVAAGEQELYGYAISGFFAGLAFLIKQPGIAAGITIFGVLAMKREYRKAIAFALSCAIPVVILFTILLRRESAFLQQFTSVGKGFWSLREAAHFVFFEFQNVYRIVPLCVGALGFVRAVKKDEKFQMIAWFALINWVVQFSGLPQVGSGLNYFLPGWVGCALLLPAAVEMMREEVRLPAAMALASLMLVWVSWSGIPTVKNVYGFYRAPRDISYSALQPYRIISDISLLSLYGHDPELLDSFAVHSLELKGHWSSSPVVENIRRGEYDLILLPRVDYKRVITHYRGVSDYAPDVVTALDQNYVVLCNTMLSYVLKPRSHEVALSPDFFSGMFGVRCGTGRSNKSPGLSLGKNAQ